MNPEFQKRFTCPLPTTTSRTPSSGYFAQLCRETTQHNTIDEKILAAERVQAVLEISARPFQIPSAGNLMREQIKIFPEIKKASTDDQLREYDKLQKYVANVSEGAQEFAKFRAEFGLDAHNQKRLEVQSKKVIQLKEYRSKLLEKLTPKSERDLLDKLSATLSQGDCAQQINAQLKKSKLLFDKGKTRPAICSELQFLTGTAQSKIFHDAKIQSASIVVLRGSADFGSWKHANSHLRLFPLEGSANIIVKLRNTSICLPLESGKKAETNTTVSIPPAYWHTIVPHYSGVVFVALHTARFDEIEVSYRARTNSK